MTAPGREWGAGRKALVWVNLGVQALLLLGLLVTANLLARRYPKRFDWSTRRAFELSSITEDALRGLDYDLEVWVTGPDAMTAQDTSVGVALQRTGQLLEEFHRRSKRVRYTMVTVFDNIEIAQVRRHWPDVSPKTLYLLARHAPDRVNKKVMDLYELYEGNDKTGAIDLYRGEARLLQALRDLGVSTKRVVYEVRGHQELFSGDARTLGALTQFLAGNEGVEFRPLDTAAARAVPEDCDLLLILAPNQPYLKHEIEMVREHLERGGSLFVALRPRVRTELEPLLEEYGIRVATDILFDPGSYVRPNPADLLVRRFRMHEINRGMAGGATIRVPESCSLEPLEKKGLKAVALAVTTAEAWGEKGPVGPGDRVRPDGGERVGEHAVAVAVEKPLDRPDRKARILAWGSYYPVTNLTLAPRGFTDPVQIQYIVNGVRWLMSRDLLEIEPKKVAVKPLEISPPALAKIKWVSVAGFPALGIVLGVIAWFLRRK